jgi:Tol biopolymer transport system component
VAIKALPDECARDPERLSRFEREARLTLPVDSATVDFHGPSFLPDGRTLLLYIHDKESRSAVAIVEGSPPHLKRVYGAPPWASVSYSSAGYLLGTAESGHSGEIWAISFSASSRKTLGPAFRVMNAAFANSSVDGMLVAYLHSPSPMMQLVSCRRGGGEQPIGEPQQGISGPAISPDGGRVAYAAELDGNSDLWVQDLVRGTRTRLTSDPAEEQHPAWSPDGSRLFYTSSGGVSHAAIVSIASDGSGAPDTIANGFQPVVSPDGKRVVYTVDRKGSGDLWMVPIGDPHAARPFLATSVDETSPAFSPDGRWVAYVSDESGRNEIFIRRFPEGDARTQVSVDGGSWPRWTRRGDGIFYSKHDTVMMVPVGVGPRLTLGIPRPWFEANSPNMD